MNEPLAFDHTGRPAGETPGRDVLTIDCATCLARPIACSDCVVSALLGPPADSVEIDPDEGAAIDALSAAGLLPPLRLVSPAESRSAEELP